MAIFNLPVPPNGTPGGTWAIANTAECGCANPNACNATLNASGVLDVTVPAETCIIYASYTVVDGSCSDVSIHQIAVSLKSCISFSNSVTSDWELHLNPLTIDSTIVTTTFVYAVVPVGAVCGDYTNAIAWGYKGNCGYTLPSDTTPKANFTSSNNTQTYQVAAGDYKVVIACVDNTVLDACEKTDCCDYEVTITDLSLCSEYSSCAPLLINYPLSPDNFTISIPMLIDELKCVRMDFNGGGSVYDDIQLQVLTTTGWEYVAINYSDPNTFLITTAFDTSIVVRAATSALIPNTPHLPANSVLFGTQYKLNFIISRASANNGTSWSCRLSCCDCLPACPPVQYSCITGVVEEPVPICATGCANLRVTGNYSRSPNDIFALVNGGCPPGVTCLGSVLNSSASLAANGLQSNNSADFSIPFGNTATDISIVSAGTLCSLNKTLLPNPITYTITPTEYILDYTPANIDIYNEVRDMINALPADKSNYVFNVRPLSDASLCNDNAGNLINMPPVYFIEDGNVTSFAMNDATGVITITPSVPATTPATCISLLQTGSPKPEIFVCKYSYPLGTVTGTIITSNTIVAYISERIARDRIDTYLGNAVMSVTCPALYETGIFIVMDPANPATTWIYSGSADDGQACPPSSSAPSRTIYQHAAGLDPTQTYGNFIPIVSTNGCVGWRDSAYLRNYTIVPGTGVGFNNCYTP